jgi:hypothetical protein
MNMKKLVILSVLFLLITVTAFAAGTSRSYNQKVVAGNTAIDILTLVTSTLTTYTAPNYTVTAMMTERPSEILQTGVTVATSIRLFKNGNGTTVPYYASVTINIGTFTTQWAEGNHMVITVTKTDAPIPNSVNWETIIPAGTNTISSTNYPLLVPAQRDIPPLAPAGYDATITSNIPGVKIFDGVSDTGHTCPFTFTALSGTHIYSVEPIATQVSPTPVTVTAGGTYPLNYTNPPNTTGGGGGGGSVVLATGGPIVVPTTSGVTVTGTAEAGGLIVVTQFTPTGKVGSYLGYNHVITVYQVWASNTAMLDGGALAFGYALTPAPQYFAVHWGGTGGLYPAPATAGYAFNGGLPHGPGGLVIGNAPFTGASYAGGVLTIGPIPTYAAKGAGTFEVILSNGNEDLPVVLSSFNAVATAQMFVNLQWTTESETNNLGFNVFRSNDGSVANAEQVNFGIINGTNTSTTHNYNFVDNSVDPETTYYYWLQMVDFDGGIHFSNSVVVTTGGNTPPPTTPDATVLRSAYPNPFYANTSTNIEMDVKTGETATLSIYNVLGQTVKTYVRQAGSHKITWNGRDDNGSVCGSGIYFYKLSSPSVNTTKKMVIVK